MVGYASAVTKDIARWHSSGLIDQTTAEALRRDVAQNARQGFSFGTVLTILAAVLLAAALLLLVATNWEAFPRLARVGMIFGVILAGYVGGAVAERRGSAALSELLFILAATAFGGGIALVAQMYHLSGEEADAILIWCLGTLAAAAALRSPALTIGAVLLAGTWLIMTMDGLGWRAGREIPLSYLLLAAVMWGVSLWTQSATARHLILLSLMGFAIIHHIDTDTLVAPIGLTIVSIAFFAWCLLQPVESERWLKLNEGGTVQGLLGFIVGMSAIQFALYEEPEFIYVAIVVFAGVVGALLLGGRDNRLLRVLAYAAFVYEICFVYVVLVGSMLGTAGFFLIAGLVLGLLAWLIRRVERRFAANAGATA